MDQGVKKVADIPYADGQRKKLDIYRPEKIDGTAPVVMFIYGGSWRAGDKFEYEFAGRALAAEHHFDCQRAVKIGVAGAEHRTHPAPGDLGQDLIFARAVGGGRRRRGVPVGPLFVVRGRRV